MPRRIVYMPLGTNILKAESRGEARFCYAEAHRIYAVRHKYNEQMFKTNNKLNPPIIGLPARKIIDDTDFLLYLPCENK